MARILAVVGFVLAGCTSVVGSGVDASPSSDDATPPDDALDAAPAPLPAEPSGFQITPDGLLANAAVDANGTLFVVGTRRASSPSLNDAVILRATGQATTAQFTGGMQNDQLYAVAGNGASVLGVGITRSFLGTANADQVLLAFAQTTSSTITLGRLYVAADEAVQPRAVSPYGAGWIIGGHHLGGARGFVAILNANGTPVRAVTFLAGTPAAELHVRRVLSDNARIYAVGYATQGALRTGFVIAFDPSNLAVQWALRVTAPIDLQVMDAAVIGTTLRVVGHIGATGVVLELAADTGAVMSNTGWPDVPLLSILRDGFTSWVAGRSGGSAFVGSIYGGELRGIQLANLSLPGLSAQALVARTAGISVLGSRTSGTVEVPLNATPVGACGGAALGAPLKVLGVAGTASVTPSTVDVRALPLVYAAATPTTSNATVVPFNACMI